MGNPVLARRAVPVTAAHTPLLRALVTDMVDTMHDARGIGLAAPQIAESLRVIVFIVPPQQDDSDDTAVSVQVLINPEFEPVDAEMEHGWEGCLSIPGLRGDVPRHARIRYRGIDAAGNRVEREATGIEARVVQHEVDHLDGILYPERMTDMRRLGFAHELDQAEAASGEPG